MKKIRRWERGFVASGLLLLATACGSGGSEPGSETGASGDGNGHAGAPARSYKTGALLYAGTGAWSPEVSSLESILKQKGLSYKKVTSSRLNTMSVDELAEYGVIVWPGGNAGTQGNSFGMQAHANLREAVQQRGVSYIGFCAGAFIAVAPKEYVEGRNTSYVGIIDLPIMDYYYLEYRGTPVAMTLHRFADGSERDILWYGGPVTPEVPGGVIARYPNGEAAMTQLWAGQGFTIITGGHPAATPATSSSLGVLDSDGSDAELTWKLVEAALKRQPLPAF